MFLMTAMLRASMLSIAPYFCDDATHLVQRVLDDGTVFCTCMCFGLRVGLFAHLSAAVDASQELMALMQPTICWARALSSREVVTEFSGGATPHGYGTVWLRARALSSRVATQRHPSQPYYSRLPS